MALKLNGTNSVAAPAYAGADADTGLQCGTDEVNLVTGGTARLHIDSSGNCGIGTSSPAQLLHISSAAPDIRLSDTDGGYVDIDAAGANLNLRADQGNTQGSTSINFFVDATERARIDSSGRVGIGTTSPSSKLHVVNPSGGSGTTEVSTIERDNSGYFFKLYRNAGSGNVGGLIGADSVGTYFAAGHNVNNRLYIDSVNDKMHFFTNSSERMRIDSSGRLLIGTTSARSVSSLSGSLQVEGTGGDSSTISVTRNVASAAPPRVCLAKSRGTSVGSSIAVQSGDNLGEISFSGADGTDANSVAATINCKVDGTPGSNDMPGRLVFSTTSDGGSSPSERMRLDSSGNLQLNGGSDVRIEFGTNGTTGTNDRNFVRGDGDNMKYNTNSGGDHIFESNGTERFIVEDDGESRLFSGNTTYTLVLSNGTDAGTAYLFLEGRYNATSNNGVSGTRSFMITTNGNIYNTNNSYNALSDAKLKENIVDASSQWQDIKDIRVRNYNFIEGQTHTQIGVVAQEVETVSPGLVSELPDRDDEGNDLGTVTKSINYSVLYMKAVKALQEAQTRIETLETQHADLLARVTALEAA